MKIAAISDQEANLRMKDNALGKYVGIVKGAMELPSPGLPFTRFLSCERHHFLNLLLFLVSVASKYNF
jgi:hypothetical protein